MTCPHCYKDYTGSPKFCPHCGGSLNAKSTATTPPVPPTLPTTIVKIDNPEPPRDYEDEDRFYWIGWIIGLFLGAVGLVFALFHKSSETRRGALTGFIVGIIFAAITIFTSGIAVCSCAGYAAGCNGCDTPPASCAPYKE